MQRYLIPAIFALSGAAGLIFEVVWARQLVLVFGNTTQAVSAILTGFFGGMAIGSWYGGRIADRVARPLRMYGMLEILLACVALLTPYSFPLIHAAYRSLFPALEQSASLVSLLKYALALAALGPATIMMGATLPTLTRHLAHGRAAIGSAFTRLYVANTMGAIFGAALAGFVLIELLGLSGAVLAGASCSATAGVIALLLDMTANEEESRRTSKADTASRAHGDRVGLALAFAFGSGFTSLAYQTLWMRLIASGTGSSTYVFTTILTVFLTGLAMGAVEYKRIRPRIKDPVGIIAVTQVATGLLVVAGMYAINSLDALPGGFVWKTLVAVLPATFAMGYGFPASSALVGGDRGDSGRQSGMLLGANTGGAIAGTFILPFFLIPIFGSPRLVAITACINVATGLLIASRSSAPARRLRNTAGAGGLAFAVILIASVLRGGVFVDPQIARMQRENAVLYRSLEDEFASVQSGEADGRKQLWVTGFSMTFLTVDAKLMPILPLMLRPASTSALTIAFGMGSSFRSAVLAGLKTDAVELVPSVPKMFGEFYPDARELLSNPNGKIIIADGRNFVELTNNNYDIVVVDPPPPLQSSGVSIISSQEFYTAVRKRLTPAGVMMQWVPWGQSLSDFKSHVRTFASVYSNVIVAAGPGGNGFYLLGSDSSMTLTPENIHSVLSRPRITDDLASAYDSPAHDTESWEGVVPKLVRISGPDVKRFAGAGALITDDHPRPEYFLIRSVQEPESWLKPEEIHPPR